jgi:chromosome segregation ATPase
MKGDRGLKRIYAEPDEQTLKEIDQAVGEKGITRHKLVLEAIDSYLHQNGPEVDSLREELDSLGKELDSLRSERDSLKTDLDEKWSEIRRLRSERDSLKRDLDSRAIKDDQLTIKLDSLRSERDQAKIESDILRKDLTHSQGIIRLKDEEISFLRGHLSQLSEKLPRALPPSEEEIKARHWWQFWRKG